MELNEYANCTECGQAREKRVLDDMGVCPLCKMKVIRSDDNPLLRETRPYA